MRSDDLLAAVFPDQAACGDNMVGTEIHIPDHPLVNETIRDCLHEAMDIDGLKAVLDSIGAGDIRTVAIDTAEPSPLSHEILNANPYAYLDDAPLEERRARAVQMRRTLGADAGEIGALDPAAIEEVFNMSWPVVRDPDELHDALLTLMVLPPVPEWKAFFEDLDSMHRVKTIQRDGQQFWAAAERAADRCKREHADGRREQPSQGQHAREQAGERDRDHLGDQIGGLDPAHRFG
jgi:ATP-dependent Lhr-like helicase